MMSDDLTTHYDAEGIERWDDGTPVSTDNAFRKSLTTGLGWIHTLDRFRHGGAVATRRVARQNADGSNPVRKLYGLTRRNDERLTTNRAPEMMTRRPANEGSQEDEPQPRRA